MVIKRRLGRTELNVSPVGFGSLGILDRYLKRWSAAIGPAVAARLFEQALDQGINLVDTARWYENSEERLGQLFPSRRDDCIIVSKTFKRDALGARMEVRESMAHLRTNYIDIYLIHHPQWPDEFERAVAPDGALAGLLQAKQAGEIGFVGISGHDPSLLCRAVETGCVDVIEIPYNALDFDLYQPVVDLASRYDIGILSMKALAAGLFSGRVDWVENALRFTLCAADIACAIVGMSTSKQISSNIEMALEVQGWSSAQRTAFVDGIVALPRDYWGLDTNNFDASRCPFHVPIAEIMRLERYRAIYKNAHRSKLEYAKLPVMASHCQTCPAPCEIDSSRSLSVRTVLMAAHRALSEPVSAREILQHGG